jgi:phage terminase large subunit-like protein
MQSFAEFCATLVLDNDRPFILEDWQRAFIDDLELGKPANWLVVPEGNGKTTLMAAYALYFAIRKPMQYISVAAAAREQAEILFRQAQGFILRSDLPGITVQEGYRRLKFDNGSRVQVFSASDRTGDGAISDLYLVDELHRHKDLSLYSVWLGKVAKRGGQLIVISTAGEPFSAFEETREKMRQTADAERSPFFVRSVGSTFVLHDWAVHDGENTDFEVIAKANPATFVTPQTLSLKYELPGMSDFHWRRFTMNVSARSQHSAISEPDWSAAYNAEGIPAGVPVWAGLDVAWKWDTTALVPMHIGEDKHLLGQATVLVPPRDGTSLDPHLVERAILLLNERNPIDTLVLDTTRAEQLASWIEEELGCRVVDYAQSNTNQVRDYESFTEGLRTGQLTHSGDAELTRHVLNAAVGVLPRGDARFIRPVQSRGAQQDQRVIDALIAAAMVYRVSLSNEPESAPPLFALV